MKLFIIIYFLLLVTFCNAQNLVPNGSFEILDSCPTAVSFDNDYQLDRCAYWYTPTLSTPDLFHACANSTPFWWMGTPINSAGFQIPKDGVGYGAFIPYGFSVTPPGMNVYWFEYLQVQLNSPLESNESYKLSFWVNMANRASSYAVTKIGGYLTLNALTPHIYGPIDVVPQVVSPSGEYLLDTAGWMEVSGVFTATGGEEFLTLGWFGDSTEVDTFWVNNPDWDHSFAYAYYYIDNVVLEKYTGPVEFPNVFSPNEDGINDVYIWPYIGGNNWVLTIYNRWGNIVFKTDPDGPDHWDGKTMQGIPCSEGVYFYALQFTNNSSGNKNGFIHLVK